MCTHCPALTGIISRNLISPLGSKLVSSPNHLLENRIHVQNFPVYIFVIHRQYSSVCLHHFLIPVCRILRNALLCRKIDIHQTKALIVALFPLKIIKESPQKISSDIDALITCPLKL